MGQPTRRHFRLGVDIGGTFTDLVLADEAGRCRALKLLSTPHDYAEAIVAGVTQLLTEAADRQGLDEIIHATTVATNAILEGRGAKTGLLTTQGFRDILEFRRLRTPQLYNLRFKPPAPLVDRRNRLPVRERLDAQGAVLEPLDEASVAEAIAWLRGERIEAVAVCLLHSYRNGAHERRIGEMVRDAMPDVFLSLSVEVMPEIREYERTSTTVVNAYVGPIVRGYVNSLVSKLKQIGVNARLRIMQSNGGVMTAAMACEKPAQIVESGPAAGVIAAQVIAERAGITNLIAFDMGGTTAKASMIENGRVNVTTEYEVGAGISVSSRLIKGGGHALKLPVIDLAEVGAGGGSIVWVDRGGRIQVGPRSAGAAPGPACYQTGGEEATVTDANLLLGYLNPQFLAGGTLSVHPDLAEAALQKIATHLSLTLEETAYGVYEVVNANMMRALKAVTTYRGRDPRDFSLLAFGGSGPVHAVAIAADLGISTIVVPPSPGVLSALGLLEARTEHHAVQTILVRLEDGNLDAINHRLEELRERAQRLRQSDGQESISTQLNYSADLRYVGQAYELTIPVPVGVLDAELLAQLAEAFSQEHLRTYGHRAIGEPIEVVNLRMMARETHEVRPELSSFVRVAAAGQAPTIERRAYFGRRHGWVSCPVLAREQIAGLMKGPVIIEDYDSTTVVPPGWAVTLDVRGNALIEQG